MIVAGWDPVDGAGVYCITLGGCLMKQNYTIGGSGSIFIYGFCDENYDKDASAEECRKFVQKALEHAITRDGSSGGVKRTAVINMNSLGKAIEDDKSANVVPA